MLLTGSHQVARATRRRGCSNGATFWHTTYIGANRYCPDGAPSPEAGSLYPMAFLVEQDPHAVVHAHFHQADQFQVMIGGDGRLGTHRVAPITVHFAAAFTAYGPILATSAGLQYFTLRNGWDPGARYMPAARAELPRPRRHREAMAGPLEITDLSGNGCEALIDPCPDGLAAWRYRLVPGARLTGPDPVSAGGQFWLVLAGELVGGATVLGPRSCLFASPDEPELNARAGAGGLDVLVLRFPVGAP